MRSNAASALPSSGASDSTPSTSTVSTEKVGWTAESDVVLTDAMVRKANEIREYMGFDFLVTSGLRTVRAQAQAMAWRIEKGDDEKALLDLYSAPDAYISAIYAAYPDIDAMAAQVQQCVDDGYVLSNHMGDGVTRFAMDVHREEALVTPFMEAVKKAGGKPVDEKNVLHMEFKGQPVA